MIAMFQSIKILFIHHPIDIGRIPISKFTYVTYLQKKVPRCSVSTTRDKKGLIQVDVTLT